MSAALIFTNLFCLKKKKIKAIEENYSGESAAQKTL